jgi:hypothetical protein
VFLDPTCALLVAKHRLAIVPSDDQVRGADVLLKVGMRVVIEANLDLAAPTDLGERLHLQHLALPARVLPVGVQPADLEL